MRLGAPSIGVARGDDVSSGFVRWLRDRGIDSVHLCIVGLAAVAIVDVAGFW